MSIVIFQPPLDGSNRFIKAFVRIGARKNYMTRHIFSV